MVSFRRKTVHIKGNSKYVKQQQQQQQQQHQRKGKQAEWTKEIHKLNDLKLNSVLEFSSPMHEPDNQNTAKKQVHHNCGNNLFIGLHVGTLSLKKKTKLGNTLSQMALLTFI